MVGKFNKKIKYQKKNFNIYKKIIRDPMNNCNFKNQKTIDKKLKFKDLDYNLKQKYKIESKSSLLSGLLDLFKF